MVVEAGGSRIVLMWRNIAVLKKSVNPDCFTVTILLLSIALLSQNSINLITLDTTMTILIAGTVDIAAGEREKTPGDDPGSVFSQQSANPQTKPGILSVHANLESIPRVNRRSFPRLTAMALTLIRRHGFSQRIQNLNAKQISRSDNR